jgi:hypothetical protein
MDMKNENISQVWVKLSITKKYILAYSLPKHTGLPFFFSESMAHPGDHLEVTV